MNYSYRTSQAFIELNPGETGTWRLPPMTSGGPVAPIIVSSFYAMAPGSGSSVGSGSGGSSGGGSGGSIPRESHGPALDVSGATTAPPPPNIARDNSRFPGRNGPRRLGDLEVFDGDAGGSSGPTMELVLELLRGGQVVATHMNHILHQTPNSGDIWALRVARKQDGSLERRRYRIQVQYPSVLPREERRIPLAFFNRGFNRNWNDNPYLESIRIKDSLLSYRWDAEFAGLYDKPKGDQYVHLSDAIKFPEIRLSAPILSAGGGPHPIPDPAGFARPDLPYFALSLEGEYAGSRALEFDVIGPNPSVTLPESLWFEARFYLAPAGQGTIGYYPEVHSSLLDALGFSVTYLSASGGTKTINVKAAVKQAIEEHLYHLQFNDSGNGFDKYLRPYLVGRYEVESIAVESRPNPRDHRDTQMVISYVGRQHAVDAEPRLRLDRARDAGATDSEPSPDYPRLFDTPGEMPIPPTPFHPMPVHSTDAGALNKVDRIVVLMMENRSFDQVLGYLSRDGMLPRQNLLSGSEGAGREPLQGHVDGLNPGDNDRDRMKYPEGSSGRIYRSQRTHTTAWPSFSLDNPCHGHACVERQISDNMKGFVADYARKRGDVPNELQLIMNYLTDAELPAYGALAREFAICDRWFCSLIGGTLPNRFISLTGDLSEDVYGSPEVENPDLGGGFAPLEAKTFFDHLTERGVDWKLFEHGYSMLRLIRNYTFDESHIKEFKHPTDGFDAAARNGTLPGVTYIEPDYIEAPGGNDDHAPADMIDGQRLIASIMDSLLHSPEGFFEKTLLVITYDEHGGFYDHVPPPYEAETTSADGTVSRRPIPPLSGGEPRLGVRVPAFVISPLVAPMVDGKVNVSHAVYDHTTIPATILRRFCGPRPPILSPRMAGASDLRGLLTLETARPRADFSQLAGEMQQIANRPAAASIGTNAAAPLRKPALNDEDDFHGLIAFSSSVTGTGAD